MLFVEFRFLGFFLLVFLVLWSLKRNAWRKNWLLLCSYVFYGTWDWRFLIMIIGSSALDYLCGAKLSQATSTRRPWLALSLLGNLGLLALFKYFNFFIQSATDLAHLVGVQVTVETLAIVLPVGISFFTFQSMSYTLDVYRGNLTQERSIRDFFLFVTFFPQLVAGPIVRASHFLPQLKETPTWSGVDVRACLSLFLIGFVKKACISDHIASVIDPVFLAPGDFGQATAWLATALYSVQIYCDFSGYSDMAIATAGLLGYRLTENFRSPYCAASITDFWRRWHISLSTWFRDYLYVPLGGNRRGAWITARNLWIVFLLCGLWHGASLNFIVWGAFHGFFLVLERVGSRNWTSRLGPLGPCYSLLVVMLGWVLFRAPDLDRATALLRSMFAGHSVAAPTPLDDAWWLLVVGFLLLHWVGSRKWIDPRFRNLPSWAFAIGFGFVAALILPWTAPGYTPFIYFQF